jgi:hypothetical protein
VGPRAALLGSLAEQVEDVGDRIGSNDPGFANRAYALSGDLRARADELKQQHLDRMGRESHEGGLGT